MIQWGPGGFSLAAGKIPARRVETGDVISVDGKRVTVTSLWRDKDSAGEPTDEFVILGRHTQTGETVSVRLGMDAMVTRLRRGHAEHQDDPSGS